MSIDPYADHSLAVAPLKMSKRVAVADMDNPVLLQGMALWQSLKGERRYPARAEVSARILKPLLRNTMLVRVVDGGRDYEYRIVGDAYVQAHGVSYQGMRWSETAALTPLYHKHIKPVYDEVVREGEAICTRGWIERCAGRGRIYSEYLFLPLGDKEVDHILIFAAYVRRDGLEHIAAAEGYFGA